MAKMQYLGTGRRKASVARVRLIPGTGKITINKRSLDEFFGMEMVKREIERPFAVAGCEGKYDVALLDTESQELFVRQTRKLTDQHLRQLDS